LNKTIDFTYQEILTSAIHKWLGKNQWHNKTSLYSFSNLNGGRIKGNQLHFPKGTGFYFSSYHSEMIKGLIKGISQNPVITPELVVSEIKLCEKPIFKNREVFFTQSPILIKRKIENREIHFTYEDEKSNDYMTETMVNKLKIAGINWEGLKIEFDKSYKNPKTKVILYKKIGNKANVCPVIIEGNPEQIEFAWLVGVGNSTGIGFGSLK
jgi:CRISPR-associated endoribonuclease Cas6